MSSYNFSSCHGPSTPPMPQPYDFSDPDEKLKLSKKLEEISGITTYQEKWLVGVQDEKGALYFIDKESGDIEDIIEFSADGDYEDIVYTQNTFFVIRADGVIFRITNWQSEDTILTDVLDTNLGEINNTEGLCYYPDSNELIIICKESPTIGKKEENARAAYTYDLDSMRFDVEPRFRISRKQYKRFLKKTMKAYPEDYKKLKEALKKAKKEMPLQPSAIAIHPITNDFYILAAVGNALLVTDRQANLKHCYYLNPKKIEQPEGLAFDKDGNLYMASESQKKKARIFRFDYKPDR